MKKPQLDDKALRQRLETEVFRRDFTVDRGAVDEEKRTVSLAFSSEEPYRRWFGVEILGHEKDEIDLEFMASGRAPLLAGHDPGDQIGVIEKAWIDPDRKGRAVVRFGRSARADELFQDVIDGIRGNVSVGYRIGEMQLVKETDDGDDTYRVTRWTPLEASLVAVPADPTVGIGRELELNPEEPISTSAREEAIMEKKETVTAAAEPVTVDVKQVENDVRQAELARIREIEALGATHGFSEEAGQAINQGRSVDEFRALVLERLVERGQLEPVADPSPEIGLTEKQTQKFSFVKAINALANPTNRKFQEAAAFEFEVSRAVADKMRQEATGILIPYEVMARDLTVGTATAGGHLVATDLLSGSFIDLLRNRMVLTKLGAQSLTGLVGDIAIPRQTSGATAYWVAESGAPTESQAAFDQVGMSPSTVGAYTDISRKLLLQSSLDIEAFVKVDLARTLALELDRVGINGSGSGAEPTGIMHTTGIGSVADSGGNGSAPDWGDVVDLWTEVAQDNADLGSLGFLTNTKVVGKLMTTEKASNTAQFVCKDFPDANGFTALAGARCGVSNQVPSNLSVGSGSNLSALIYGNFSDLIYGHWGTLDLTVDPYTASTSGTVRVVVLQDVDLAVRHPESFAVKGDCITS